MTVLKPGLLSTIQDQGRHGYLALGVPLSGAMDPHAHAVANLLAGNPSTAATIELTLLGGAFRFEEVAYAALAGAEMHGTLDGVRVPSWSAFPVPKGAVLALASASIGVRSYLAVHGGIDVPLFLGSRSTYTRAAVGGFKGRPLRAGDVLPIGRAPRSPRRTRMLPGRTIPRYPREIRLRVLMGPQDDRFSSEGLSHFLGSPYAVTNRNDRMGYQLEGPAIDHRNGAGIVSDAVLPGAIQVAGSGTPIVLTADAQTVGGYAKIAAVIGADLPKIAQARRGDAVRFARWARERLDAIAATLGPAPPTE